MNRRAVVVTVSDSVSAGEKEDLSGPAVREVLEAGGWTVSNELVPDEEIQIAALLARLADGGLFDAIFTTGGTGVAPRDVTPEATRRTVDREIPGLAETMRAEGRKFTPRAVLSRGIAGTRGQVLIVNLPGSPKGAVQSLAPILDLVPHVIDLLQGNTQHAPERETAAEGRASEN